jgi:NADH-quinone oxidoreductase subunit L
MEGPTPVSALIHAATMVTAGVYLIARTFPLFELAPTVQDLAAGLGAGTLILAGLVALVQTDIKRVIAYSTMSQIGYMFVGVGLGAYANGMFHLMTHAFFKALLFMGAGIVIHALAGEQDIRRMGGLRERMPRTALAMLIGALALAGIPPLSGFFSKDSILASALDHGAYGYVLWVVGLAGAFLTGLYTFRLIFVVFGGPESDFVRTHLYTAHAGHDHGLGPNEPGAEPAALHEDRDTVSRGERQTEGPWTMTAPVAVLAVLAAIGGWIQFADLWTPIEHWLEPSVVSKVHAGGWEELVTSVAAVALAVAGIVVAWTIYGVRRRRAPRSSLVLERKFFFDELYSGLFYYPAVATSKVLAFVGERGIVAGGTTGLAEGFRDLGIEARRLQTGFVRSYVLLLAASLAVLVIVFMAVR